MKKRTKANIKLCGEKEEILRACGDIPAQPPRLGGKRLHTLIQGPTTNDSRRSRNSCCRVGWHSSCYSLLNRKRSHSPSHNTGICVAQGHKKPWVFQEDQNREFDKAWVREHDNKPSHRGAVPSKITKPWRGGEIYNSKKLAVEFHRL